MKRYIYLFALLLVFLAGCTPSTSSTTQTPAATPTTAADLVPSSSVPGLNLPQGFQISAYATGFHTARLMTMGPGGVLLVANRGGNSVVAVFPGKTPQRAAKTQTLLSNLHDPTSLDMHAGYLYIGEGNAIARVKLDNQLHMGSIERIIPNLPLGGQHSTRTVLVGPDNHIYVAIGSTCNVCNETNPHRAAIWVYNMDGSHGRLFAKGLRNAVGMQINPWTKQIWVTNNGRDLLGDDVPPETIYALVDQGDYGWPRCHAGDVVDPEFGKSANACQGVQQPLIKMQAHSAPLGLAFYTEQQTQFPEQYRNSLYVAFHGSWNRSVPTGYKVIRIPLNNGRIAGPPQDFITGFLQSDGTRLGRPVGITLAPDGSMFVSDDAHNTIYHVWYHG